MSYCALRIKRLQRVAPESASEWNWNWSSRVSVRLNVNDTKRPQEL